MKDDSTAKVEYASRPSRSTAPRAWRLSVDEIVAVLAVLALVVGLVFGSWHPTPPANCFCPSVAPR